MIDPRGQRPADVPGEAESTMIMPPLDASDVLGRTAILPPLELFDDDYIQPPCDTGGWSARAVVGVVAAVSVALLLIGGLIWAIG